MARSGSQTTPDEDSDARPEETSAAVYRARYLTAYRVWLARMIAGHDDEPSPEAQAGELLDAETAVEIYEIARFVRAQKG